MSINRNYILKLPNNISNMYYSNKIIDENYINTLKKENFYLEINNQNDVNNLTNIINTEKYLKTGILKSIIFFTNINDNIFELLFSGNFNINDKNQHYDDIKYKTKILLPSFTTINITFDNNITY